MVSDNPSGVPTGVWTPSTAVGGYVGSNYQVAPAGTGANSFAWSVGGGAGGQLRGVREVDGAPEPGDEREVHGEHAGGSETVTVNQQANSASWQLLGTYALGAAGSIGVVLSDEANGYVIADAVKVQPVNAAPNTASWTVSLGQAKTYRVYARWTQHPNRATDAKYTVSHAGGSQTVVVNQEVGGGQWNLLGTYAFGAGAATVTLTDEADGYVIADAVRWVPEDAQPNRAVWTPNVGQAGSYEVYARWTANANRATNATYTVTHGQGSTATQVNQQQEGGVWNLLGTYTLAPGTGHRVTLTDEANGYVVADAIRLVAVNLTPAKQVYYIHPDHLNTPRLIADQNQTTVWRWDQQEPFGANLPEEDPDNDTKAFAFNLRFPGQYFDKETGLHYNYFRDYDPSMGRYTQSDPIGLAGGINTYAYVDGNPTSYSDPYGLLLSMLHAHSRDMSMRDAVSAGEMGNAAAAAGAVAGVAGTAAGTLAGAVATGAVEIKTLSIIGRIIRIAVKGVPDETLPPPPPVNPPSIIRPVPISKGPSGGFCKP
ncbi:MAG: hypothetical protein IPK29_15170 [Betaproteobacteria bacterium]|nr:hypothetical protein [Betaproteobacteria bacterium]